MSKMAGAEGDSPTVSSASDSAKLPTTYALDHYVTSLPSAQNALDIFQGEWASKLPTAYNHLTSGPIPLFEDSRIIWFLDRLGGVEGKTVLELGPLEGGHTYMMERAGATSIVAVEANTRAYLKCLITKEILGLNRAHFLCGDFVEHLRINRPRVDVCLASGVLYHMTNPVELLSLIARAADRVCLWTQYYDEQLLANRPQLIKQFGEHIPNTFEGFAHTEHRRYYETEGLGWQGFCGGTKPSSCWLSRQDIMGALRHFGLKNLEIGFDEPEHQNGPSMCLTATRK